MRTCSNVGRRSGAMHAGRAVRGSLLAVCGAAALLAASVAPAADMDAAAQVLVKLDDAWAKVAATKDADGMASFYAEDAIAYPPNEPAAVGRAAAQKVWAAAFAIPGFAISWKTTHAQIRDDLGFTAGTYQDSYTGPDGNKVSETGKYLCVWKKQKDGSWKAIHDMWNADGK
jgi:ketosteroid isomerase-like protein